MSRLKKQETGNYTFESEYVNDDGVVESVTAAVSVTIADGLGVQVYTGTPTLTSGHLTVTIPVATLPKLDIYTFTWTAAKGGTNVTWKSQVELVGGYIFEIIDLRAMDRAFADTTKYPTEDLKRVRDWVEDVIEGPRAANVAFVPRGRHVTLQGPGLSKAAAYGLQAPDYELRSVYSAKVLGTALTSDEVTALVTDDNMVWRSREWPAGHQNIQLHYAHGLAQVPGAITRAALILAREYLVKSDLPGRATATSIGDQMFRLTIAGRDGVTGIPDVDAAIDQFGRKGYGIG